MNNIYRSVSLVLLAACAVVLTACPPNAPTRKVLVTPEPGNEDTTDGNNTYSPDGDGTGQPTGALTVTTCRTTFFVSTDASSPSCYLTKDSHLMLKELNPVSKGQMTVVLANSIENCDLSSGVLFRAHVGSDESPCQ